MRADELWFSDTPKAKMLRTVLTPLSWVYAAGWQVYLGFYLAGLKRAKEPHRPVLCVGNLTVGGSGKTPVVLHLYNLLKSIGHEVVVSSSGYGSPARDGARAAPPGELKPSEWGDEAAMLRWLEPEMPIVVGRNRVEAAKIAHQSYPNAVLLLDDGFQHLPLQKHFSILLDDPSPSNRRCLPAGPYREPRINRARADLVLPEQFEVKWEGQIFLDPLTSKPVFSSEKDIQVLCALGRPDRFLRNLSHEGYQVKRQWLLDDHDPLLAGNLLAAVDREIPLVVTAKDWVKLKERSDIGLFNIWVAFSDATIEPADSFRKLLHATLSKTQ